MGADLYMNRAYDEKCAEKKETLDSFGKAKGNGVELTQAQKQHMMDVYDDLYKQGDVYFRDSYNSGSVMWAMGMSWWDDVVPMLDKDGNLSHEDTLKLVNMITDAPLNVSTDFLENMPDEWTIDDAQKYLREEQQKLVGFLKRAVETDDTVSCSL